jgi:hypothetical protein
VSLPVLFSHDASDSAVLDFCTLLHAEPDLLRLSPIVRGFVVNEDGIVTADDMDTDAANSTPMEESKFQHHMQTINMYLALKQQQ